MKFAIIFAALFAIAFAAPAQEVEILRYDSDVQPDGYKFAVETSDGKKHEEEGLFKNAGTDSEVFQVRGSYSYVDENGVTYTVTYIADENGFQPEGDHLPHA